LAHHVLRALAARRERGDRDLDGEGVHVEGPQRVDAGRLRRLDEVELLERTQRAEVETDPRSTKKASRRWPANTVMPLPTS
jgi:hypothetical protein